LLILNKEGDVSKRNLKPSQRSAGLFTAVLLAALWLGCTKGDDTKGQADTSGTVVTAIDSLAPTDGGLDDAPGNNPNRTLAYLHELNAHWRTAVPDTATLECEAGSVHRPVHVLLYTHELSYKIDTKQVLDRHPNNNARGHIAMKLVNRDTVACADIDLQPNDSLYLWAGKVNGAKRSFALFRIDAQGNATSVKRALRGIRCSRAEPTESGAHVILAGHCEPDATGMDTLYTDAPIPNKVNLSGPLHDQGLWYSCPGGCCQASNFGQ